MLETDFFFLDSPWFLQECRLMLGNHSSLLDEFPRFLPVVRLMHRPTMQRHAVRSFSGKRQKSLATTLPVVVILPFIVVFIKLVNNGLLWVIMGYYGLLWDRNNGSLFK
jgi:hypothetical protein